MHTDYGHNGENPANYLLLVSPTCRNSPSVSFAEYFRRFVGKGRNKISQRRLALDCGIHPSAMSRLLNGDSVPKLATAARIIERAHLSDEQVYKLIMDFVPDAIWSNTDRWVFRRDAPVLEGNLGEQLKGYRLARNGVTMHSLELSTRVDHSTLSRIERQDEEHQRIPILTTFVKTVYGLGLNARQIHGLLRVAAANTAEVLAFAPVSSASVG